MSEFAAEEEENYHFLSLFLALELEILCIWIGFKLTMKLS